jgi:beta-glucosidase
MVAWYEDRLGPLDAVWDGDLAIASEPIDFLGVNYYTRQRFRARARDGLLETVALPPAGPTTAMGWEVVPDALDGLLRRLKRDYGDLPILITENGAAYSDRRNGRFVEDSERVEYLRAHVAAVASAIAAGVDVRGYFAWSLLDNFEWEEGYAKRFGLIYVDYASLARTPKRSALWYRDLVAANGRDRG